MDDDATAKLGDLRITDDDDVEVFDGAKWRAYRNLPPGDLDTILRDDPKEAVVVRRDNPPRR